MNKLRLEVLRENINKLNLSAEWVRRSYELTKAINDARPIKSTIINQPQIIFNEIGV